MATLTLISSLCSSLTSSATHKRTEPSSFPSTTSFPPLNYPSQRPVLGVGSQKLQSRRKRNRGSWVITSAGPSTTSYIFAFVFPLSLIAVTVFTSIRIADELDRKFLEEIATNQEILEAEEAGTGPISLEEKPEGPRKRNRPKREAEASSM